MATDSAASAAKPNTDPLAGPRRQAMITIFGEKFANSFMGPVHFIDNATLHSPAAIRFFQRDFEYISKVLNYEYQYRSWDGYDQGLLDRYAEIITKKQASIRVMMENWCNRLNKLLEQNKVSMESAVYSSVLTTTVPVISGHARGYFLILQELDRVNLLAGTANLMGVIDSSQRAEAEFICKKSVRAFGAALRNEVVRLYREADRLMKEQHGKDTASTSKKDEVAAQGEELKKFGDAMTADGKSDSSLNLGSADPGQLIDDAAAATAAAVTKTAVRKKSTKADAPVEAAPAAT